MAACLGSERIGSDEDTERRVEDEVEADTVWSLADAASDWGARGCAEGIRWIGFRGLDFARSAYDSIF